MWGDIIEIIMILSLYILAYFFFRNSAIGMIDEIRTNFRFFPKHYALPPRWIRKHFNLRKEEIPKFLLFRLYVSLFFAFSAPLAILICMLSRFNTYVVGVMLFLPCFVIPDTFVFMILAHVFKKKQQNHCKKQLCPPAR